MSTTLDTPARPARPTPPKSANNAQLQWRLSAMDFSGESAPIRTSDAWPFLVGRSDSCSFTVGDDQVAEVHTELRPVPEGLWIRDLSSTGKTLLGGRPIKEAYARPGDVLQIGKQSFKVDADLPKDTEPANEAPWSEAQEVDRLFFEAMITPAFQPITSLNNHCVIGMEVLGRSMMFGLTTPEAMFAAARGCGREAELSRLLRWEGVVQAQALHPDMKLFLNSHSLEFSTTKLLASLELIHKLRPQDQFVLEIDASCFHRAENNSADNQFALSADSQTGGMRFADLVERLRQFGAEICIEQFEFQRQAFAAIEAGLVDFVKLAPSVTASLKEIEPQGALQKKISRLRESRTQVIATHVESVDDLDACLSAEIEFAQGFYLGVHS